MKSIITRNCMVFVCGCFAIASAAQAAPYEVRVPLHDGKLHAPDLAAAISREMHLPAFKLPDGEIDVQGLRGSLFVRGLNTALGEGCRITVEPDALILHIDADKLPANMDDAHRAIRIFTGQVAPDATARQAKHWGLFLPEHFDDQRPLVVMIHGLDSGSGEVSALGNLLKGAGHQVAYFSYPDGQPLADSSRLLADHMAVLQQQHPALKINLIGHSLGGLVARAYVEEGNYHGGVDHLILIATPNAGSKWASGEIVLKIRRQRDLSKFDPDWNWTWGITNGLGESARDLLPNSPFLNRLNALPRRAGVRYTIIAGNQNLVGRFSAEAAEAVAGVVPKKAESWWGFRHYKEAMEDAADRMRNATSVSDGIVDVESAKLAGVEDVVVLPADHATLVWPDHGNPPAAWPAIKKRLGR